MASIPHVHREDRSMKAASQKTLYQGSHQLSLPPIEFPYLLVTNIPCYLDREGKRYIDPLWYKDLIEHFKYLPNFTLASPCFKQDPPLNLISLDKDPLFSQIQFVDLPASTSFVKSLLTLPATTIALWKAIGQAKIVHSGVAGWPLPLGWVVTPLVRLQRKFYLIIVESAAWRVPAGTSSKLTTRLRAAISEIINSWCINQTDLPIFTQAEYCQSLLKKHADRGHIINASWIDETSIIPADRAKELWQRKLSAPALKLLFAGRLQAKKGVLVLLEAMKILEQRGIPIQLDILGEGELLGACQATRQNKYKSIQIRTLGTLPYGPEFFKLLQEYHGIVVPSLSDEQPRIVYDAYSQALPILGSNTPGIRDCVDANKTGKLVKPNDPVALADLLQECWQNLSQLESMGKAALRKACSLTHQEMHRKRWELLVNSLATWKP